MDDVRTLLKESSLPRLETQMLLQHVLQVPRVWLIAHDTDPIEPHLVAEYQTLAQHRLAGQPMAYLLGHREFMGHVFSVSPAVLIPRPETELLVETALHELNNGVRSCNQASEGRALDGVRSSNHAHRDLGADRPFKPRVLDLGTGTGAIAISIALACPDAQVIATDLSATALDLARQNAHRLSAGVEFLHGSWYDALSGQSAFDLIVSNPPYISANDPHLSQGDLRFEPPGALTDGADGLGALRHIVQGASTYLKPGGALWMEHGWDQAAAVRNLLQQAGFKQVKSLPDLAGIERISGGYL